MEGKKTDVIVTLLPRTDKIQQSPFGDAEDKTWDFDRLKVWADAGLLSAFEQTPGIMKVHVDINVSIMYVLLIDPRYDTQWVIEEIKAVAQIEKPVYTKPKPEPMALYPWNTDDFLKGTSK